MGENDWKDKELSEYSKNLVKLMKTKNSKESVYALDTEWWWINYMKKVLFSTQNYEDIIDWFYNSGKLLLDCLLSIYWFYEKIM